MSFYEYKNTANGIAYKFGSMYDNINKLVNYYNSHNICIIENIVFVHILRKKRPVLVSNGFTQTLNIEIRENAVYMYDTNDINGIKFVCYEIDDLYKRILLLNIIVDLAKKKYTREDALRQLCLYKFHECLIYFDTTFIMCMDLCKLWCGRDHSCLCLMHDTIKTGLKILMDFLYPKTIIKEAECAICKEYKFTSFVKCCPQHDAGCYDCFQQIDEKKCPVCRADLR